MTIVALSGTQGTGKSTILALAESLGYRVNRTAVSRTVQARLGWERLSLAEESFKNAQQLQEMILEVMYDRDESIRRTGEVTLVERSYADVWAYAWLWAVRAGIPVKECAERDWLYEYQKKCRALIADYRKIVIVPEVDAIPFVADPNRADAASRTSVDASIRNFVIRGGLPYHTMTTITPADRGAEIGAILTLIKIANKKDTL